MFTSISFTLNMTAILCHQCPKWSTFKETEAKMVQRSQQSKSMPAQGPSLLGRNNACCSSQRTASGPVKSQWVFMAQVAPPGKATVTPKAEAPLLSLPVPFRASWRETGPTHRKGKDRFCEPRQSLRGRRELPT